MPYPDETLEAYDYALPDRLIAQAPAQPRDSSRLLVVERASGRLRHARFTDLAEFVDSSDCLVANNTRVIRARLLGRRLLDRDGRLEPGGKVEFLMLERKDARTWEGLFHASAKYVPGLRFEIPTPDGRGLRGVLVRGSAESPSGTVVAEFDRDPLESGAGYIPLPSYIRRAQDSDEQDYQTRYAREPGSAAAPTAGLHFTEELIGRLRAKGASWEEVTLHVGLGTFRPVKTSDLSRHVMHEERYVVSPETASRINAAKAAGRRVLAVGTTSVRTLESAWIEGQGVAAGEGRTSLFIRPGHFRFRCVDRLLTNFHLPKSTLLMLVSAFAGRELVMEAYREAVRREYRFFSYGDAMLVL